MPNSDAMDNSGMMCPTNGVGRPGMSTSHVCVDITCRPSASATLRGLVVTRLFLTGVPSMMKICVAPESAIAACGGIVIVAWANSRERGGLPWMCFDTFDETNVTSSSVAVVITGIQVWVGYGKTSVT